MTDLTKGWTDERRQAARERILKNKPWEKSTGPKTPEGKLISSLNACQHGERSKSTLMTEMYLKGQRNWMTEYRNIQTLQKELIKANELLKNLLIPK